ncbi:MAG: hypothetical protein MUC96_32080 [Myxococcaceae bacterium]|jgi:hypothetical protein|nr:hypothetical protein [Myxococcaceae bacterium]
MALVLSAIAATGCTRPRQAVTIEAASASVPADFVPLAPERVAKLREAALSSDPSLEVSMVGRKPPDAALPWMYLQRAELRPQVTVPLTVNTLLERTINELKATINEGGLELVEASTTVVGDTHEFCSVAKSTPKSGKGAQVLSHTCLRVWVGAKSRKVHTVSVVCLSLESDPEECRRIIGSRALTPGEALPLSTLYER